MFSWATAASFFNFMLRSTLIIIIIIFFLSRACWKSGWCKFLQQKGTTKLPQKTTSSCFFSRKQVCQRLKVLIWFFNASSTSVVSTTTTTHTKFQTWNLHKRSSGWSQNHEITIELIWSCMLQNLKIYHHMITSFFWRGRFWKMAFFGNILGIRQLLHHPWKHEALSLSLSMC